MPSKIRINQVAASLELDRVDRRFDLFRIRTSSKYIARGSMLLDSPLLERDVVAVRFDGSRTLYALMSKSPDSRAAVGRVVSAAAEASSLSFEGVCAREVPKPVLIQLLLNALNNFKAESLRFSNLTGRLYCFNPRWISRRRIGGSEVVAQVKCLEIEVDEEMRLEARVRTFTSERLRGLIRFKPGRPFESYPKYVMTGRSGMRRRLAGDAGECLIMRQVEGRRSTIGFAALSCLEDFESSKVGVIEAVIDRFNREYEGLARIDLVELDAGAVLRTASADRMGKAEVALAGRLLGERGVDIVDEVGDADSVELRERLELALAMGYGVTAGRADAPQPGRLSFRIVHEPGFRERSDGTVAVEDPYRVFPPDTPVQHMTLEASSSSLGAVARTAVNNVLVKEDIRQRRISLFDWEALGLEEDTCFAIDLTEEGEPEYAFMTVRGDGSFELLHATEETALPHLLEDARRLLALSRMGGEEIDGLIAYADGQIDLLKDSGWFTMPEGARIRCELAARGALSRAARVREEVLGSCIDVNVFEHEGQTHYFAGTIGSGMNAALPRAVRIRRVESHNGSSRRLESLMPLFGVTFVRTGQLTVRPFPFKYLREYARLLRAQGEAED